MSKFKVGDRVSVNPRWDKTVSGVVMNIDFTRRYILVDRDDSIRTWHYMEDCEIIQGKIIQGRIIHEDPKNQVIDQMNADRENFVVLQPGEVWTPGGVDTTKTCTCGMTAIGGGLHSNWCDLYEDKNDE